MTTNIEFVSMTQLLADLRTRLKDGGDARYALAEKYAALQDAARSLHGRYGVPSVYTSLNFAAGAYDYGIPHYIHPENVLFVERKDSGIQARGNSYEAANWRKIPWFEIRPTTYTNFLYVDESYTTAETRIWYVEHVPSLPPAEGTLGEAIGPTQTSIPLAATTSSLGIQDYQSHGYLELREGSKREVVFYENVTGTSFVNVTRQISGVAASFNSGATVSPVIIMPPGRVGVTWLLNEARALCMETHLNDAAVGDKGDATWLTRWHRQRSEELRTVLSGTARMSGEFKIGRRGRFL